MRSISYYLFLLIKDRRSNYLLTRCQRIDSRWNRFNIAGQNQGWRWNTTRQTGNEYTLSICVSLRFMSCRYFPSFTYRISRIRSFTFLECSSISALIYLVWYSSTKSSSGFAPITLGFGVGIGFPINTRTCRLCGIGVPHLPWNKGRAIPKFFWIQSRGPNRNE